MHARCSFVELRSTETLESREEARCCAPKCRDTELDAHAMSVERIIAGVAAVADRNGRSKSPK